MRARSKEMKRLYKVSMQVWVGDLPCVLKAEPLASNERAAIRQVAAKLPPEMRASWCDAYASLACHPKKRKNTPERDA